MTSTGKQDEQSLARSLSRTRAALARTSLPVGTRQAHRPGPAASALGGAALALFVLAFATGQHWLLALALIFAAGGAALFAVPAAQQILLQLAGHGSPGQTYVGMGATVAADAVLEPGASVEMGATVGRRAVVRSGAVVRIGATVGKDSVIEKGAVVSWGATVHSRAVVEEGAIVGAGSDVLSGARVPSGLRLRPGARFGAGSPLPAGEARRPAPVADPREARVAAVCDKLQAELRASPEQVRAFLGGSDEVIASLRRTCQDLARRERELRAEVGAGALERLGEERAALEKRIGAERDEDILRSLRGAIAAIDEQKRQRELVRLAADRLDAEHTRLVYTLEGLASQFVRLRTAGAEGRAPAELEQGVAQLRSELDAIADALDDVSRAAPPSGLRALAESPPAAEPDSSQRSGMRTRG